MNNLKRWMLSVLTLLLFIPSVYAQISGVVIDDETGDSLSYVRLQYKNDSTSFRLTDFEGSFIIERREGQDLVFTSMGYNPTTIHITEDTPLQLVVRLKSEGITLKGVEIKNKGIKYSRKNNPAVDLMRRIIAANKKNNLKSNDFYEYYKYQKLILAKNNVDQDYIDSLRALKSKEWMTEQVEICPLNNKLILPIQINETVTRSIYRREEDDERNITLGENKTGMMSQMSTMGDMFNVIIKDCFVDVDIYQNQVRLLDQSFISPIGNGAIAFYHFYIQDTLMVGNDLCYQLYFAPNNHQDVGFSGHIYALADSSLHIRRAELSLPKESGVNFVDKMSINQEWIKLEDGQWVLDSDDMLAEMSLAKILKNAVVTRRTKYSQYSFDPLPKSQFHGRAHEYTVPESSQRTKDFWNSFRTLELSKSESTVDKYTKGFLNRRGIKQIYKIGRIVADDYLQTSYRDSVPSKFDFGPLTTLVGKNTYDGWRTRVSARTTTGLSHHLFWKGYIAYGFGSKKIYYQSEFTYSFNHKNNQPWEFPIRQLTVNSTYGMMTPYDKFLLTSNDNWITSIHVKKLDKYYLYNQQNLSFKWETQGGLCVTAETKFQSLEGAMKMEFHDLNGNPINQVRTSEVSMGLRYAPGETYYNTMQRRYPLNANAMVFYAYHSSSFKNVLGGQYASNYSELSFQKRVWPRSWGKMDFYVAAKAQWNQVPFPLLIMPTVNLSWITQHDSHTFELMNNMEFLNDRVLQWQYCWNLNGKIFNRIPGIKKLDLREVILFRGMWGHLTDKNDPENYRPHGENADPATNRTLLLFPSGSESRLGKVPYMEVSVGIHNIFKFLEVDYVYRINYRNEPNAIKWGVRFGWNLSF